VVKIRHCDVSKFDLAQSLIRKIFVDHESVYI
jgi:hypothetical protein